MSSFTNWNGPHGCGPTKDMWQELINEYKQLLDSNNYVQKEAGKGLSTEDFTTALKNKLDAINEGTASKDIGNVASGSAGLVTGDAVYQFCKDFVKGVAGQGFSTNDFSNAYKDILDSIKEAASRDVAVALTDADAKLVTVAVINTALQNYVQKEAGKGLSTNDFTDEYINLLNLMTEYSIIFNFKHFEATVGGSDIDGVYYLLGMLDERAGTAYIKFANTKSFSAVINFAVTPEWKGALSVTTDCELKGLKFKVVSGTDSSGQHHAYLAIQSSEWFSNFASSDGVGWFDHLEFFGSGINFIPAGTEKYKRPVGNCADVCDCLSGKGFSFSELATVLLNARIYRGAGNPYIALKDITALDHVGIISQWTDYDDNGIAINVPEGYHACDGTPVLDTDDVSDEFRAKYTEYPLVDYSIIKTKSSVEVEAEDIDQSTQSLAEAICALHGIKFYKGVSTLPDTAKEGEPVIVQTGNTYAVYVYNNSEGWKKYSTEFNDINKTISAVAAVIAAEHGADVYTVYDSVAALPTGPDVETGALAIVFDGVAYNVFKYNGTAWEVQV